MRSTKKHDPAMTVPALVMTAGILLSVVLFSTVRHQLAPRTAIGPEGLRQVRLYLYWLFFGTLLKALTAALSVWIGYAAAFLLRDRTERQEQQRMTTLYALPSVQKDPELRAFMERMEARRQAQARDEHRQIRLPRAVPWALSIVLFFTMLLTFPQRTGWEVQFEKNGYEGPGFLRTAAMIRALEQDMHDPEPMPAQEAVLTPVSLDYSYRSHSRSGSHRVTLYEYCLADPEGRTAAQITESDYRRLSGTLHGACSLYRESGLICELPDTDEAQTGMPDAQMPDTPWAELYTLHFEREDSAYHVDPVPPEGQRLVLTVYLNGEVLREGTPWPAGEASMEFHVGWDGEYTACLQMEDGSGSRYVVSNVERFDTQELAAQIPSSPPPTEPPAPAMEGTVTDNGDGTCTVDLSPYPVTFTVPETLEVTIPDEPAQSDLNGEYRTLCEGGSGRMYLRAEWMHLPYMQSTPWLLEDRANSLQKSFEGSRVISGELTSQDGRTGYWLRLERGTSDLEYPHLMGVYEIGDHTYVLVTIACADVNVYPRGMEVLESFYME